jgi:CRISPR-associated protein (TIGR03984 family)
MPEITPLDSPQDTDLESWLTTHVGDCKYMLAHAEDGVIWGHFAAGTLRTSHDVFPKECAATLRHETLLQCRLFGPHREVLLWRDDDSAWHARAINEPQLPAGDFIDEDQMLWGTSGQTQQDFTLLTDGAEGLCHAVPKVVPAGAFNPEKNPRPLRLKVRHYVEYDHAGVAYIALSRLVDLS